ncbi:MAG: hypothetical protein ACKO40_13390 [Planctomycetaceae bacterium]
MTGAAPRTIVVAGALATKPGNAGGAWERFSFAAGFRRLGFDVLFVEEVAAVPEPAAVRWFDDAVTFFGFGAAAAIVGPHGWSHGRTRDDVRRAIAGAYLLVNLSGNLRSPDLLESARATAYIDVDPGFTQIWHADPGVGYLVPRHDHYLTIGENIGSAGCPIPTGGLAWKPTRQPLLLDHWPATPSTSCTRFTTIASWRAPFGSLLHDGVTYGLKVHEFRRLLDLPRRVPATFELALEIHDGDARDRETLVASGWHLVPPVAAVPTPAAFRDYIQQSDAEFSVAQGVYAHAASGWFSDRSTRYLASGKPVLVQDTGLTSIPTGEGIVTFRTLDDAVAGAERITRDYFSHARAARRIAETHFASDIVLRRLLADCGLDA